MEKFQAMVLLGRDNSRMTDFYDIWLLSQAYEFDSDRLASDVRAPEHRDPGRVAGRVDHGVRIDPAKMEQWNAFKRGLAVEPGLRASPSRPSPDSSCQRPGGPPANNPAAGQLRASGQEPAE